MIMSFDECASYPCTYEYMKIAWNELYDGQTWKRSTQNTENRLI